MAIPTLPSRAQSQVEILSGQSVSLPTLAPPLDSSLFSGGYDANNIILGGSNNKITDGRRCSIINGAANYMSGLYNTHILGDIVSPQDQWGCNNYGQPQPLVSNAFYVGCTNGLHLKGDVIAYSTSDERLKDDVSFIKDPLKKILSLDAIEFNWSEKQEVYSGSDIGLIAQQVEKIAPQLVTTRENGYKAVKYDKITSILVGAIKDQQEQIDALKVQVESLLKNS
tara:strand:- start:1256 stop:1930 length:675 start_codon:yes stop_codon:yes gene_type:complete